MKDVNELLKPRYEVIADYPDSRNELGQIICDVTKYMEAFYDKYPHLFRKLQWWEHRDVSEMPEYLRNEVHERNTGDVEIIKAIRYEEYYVCDASIPHWSFYVYPEWNKNEGFPLIYFIPATIEEYNQYTNQSKSEI